MFKNGDRVEVLSIEEDLEGEFYTLGATGTVIDAQHPHALLVLFDEDASGENESWYINGNHIALLVPEEN